MPDKERKVNKVMGCSLFKTKDDEPITLVTDILKRSGVRIGKIDKRTNQVFGKIGRFLEPHFCKVMVRIYSQGEMSLVELVCEGAWGRPGERVLSDYVEVLCKSFDDVTLAEIERSINWEPTTSNEENRHRSHTDAVALLRNLEAEI